MLVDARPLRRVVQVAATEGAKQLAAEHGVELAQVEGTGNGGTVTVGDVKRYLKSRGNT